MGKKLNLRSSDEIKKAIVAVAATATALGGSIHELAIECLEHALPEKEGGHNNPTLFQTLYNELPKSQRREALLVWCNKYTPVRVTQQGAKVGIQGMGKDNTPADKCTPWDLEAAKLNPYWELDERNGFSVRSTNIASFLNRELKKHTEALMRDEADVFTFPDGYNAKKEIKRIHKAADALNISLTEPDRTKIENTIETEQAHAESIAA